MRWTLGLVAVLLLAPPWADAKPPRYRAYDELIAATRARRIHRQRRDRHVAAARKHLGRRNLEPALKAYRKAVACEQKHELRAESEAVYAALEAEGRRRLAVAAALTDQERATLRRKLARLFAGLPLGEQLK